MIERVTDLRETLRRFTSARVGLGKAVSTGELLEFQLDHALARDAVHARLDVSEMVSRLEERGLETVALRSAVAGDGDRREYLRRPDLGRVLCGESAGILRDFAGAVMVPDVVFVVVDGLSALAVERHALALLDALGGVLDAPRWRVGPVCVVQDGRVAVGDEIGAALGARVVVVMIGERPGLSAADSLGVYVTWEPRVGRTDAERNCVSNIRAEGLGYEEAARRVVFYMEGAKRLGASGVGLKESAGLTG